MTAIHSYGFGLATENSSGEIIEVYYPHFGLDAGAEFADEVLGCCGLQPGASGYVILDEALRERLRTHLGALASSEKTLVLCVLGADIAPATVAEAFLKLHLLSARLVKPHALNLNGMFGVLHNLAWTNEGPIDLSELPDRQLAARLQGRQLSVTSVDKFPKMSDYIVPTGVRIADSARVRLGAYLGEGTTVMHEGFINFNAGTEGPAMIEGRISAGVMVGANSDLGGRLQHDGHTLGWWQTGDFCRRKLPNRRERWHWHTARKRLCSRSGPLRNGRHQSAATQYAGRAEAQLQGYGSCWA